MSTPTQVGIFGGTFNPPHFGHLIAAQAAVEQLNLDQLLWIPTGSSYHKNERGVGDHRLEMVKLAIAGNPRFSVSTVDIERAGPTYTFDTITDLEEQMPDATFTVVVGQDSWNSFASWHRADELQRRVRIAVVNRNSADFGQESDRLRWVRIPQIDLSSSAARSRAESRQSLRYWMPDSVAEYITTHRLYQESNDHLV